MTHLLSSFFPPTPFRGIPPSTTSTTTTGLYSPCYSLLYPPSARHKRAPDLYLTPYPFNSYWGFHGTRGYYPYKLYFGRAVLLPSRHPPNRLHKSKPSDSMSFPVVCRPVSSDCDPVTVPGSVSRNDRPRTREKSVKTKIVPEGRGLVGGGP